MPYLLALVAFAMVTGHLSANDDPATRPTAPASLEGTYWWVESIGEQGVVDASHTTIGFTSSGQVAGDTGCNRYAGAYEQSGSSLVFGSLAGTRRACPEALMGQEQRLYHCLSQVQSWRIGADGLLYLIGPDDELLIRASAIIRDEL